MPVWRITLIAAFSGLVLLCLFGFASGLASGPGEGEVSVILYGGLMMLALVLAGFFALVVALFAFWDRIWLRRALSVCVAGPMIAAAAYFAFVEVQEQKREAAYEQRQAAERARRDDIYRQVVPISNRYLQQLAEDGFVPERIHALRADFYAEMERSAIDGWQRSEPKYYFDMVTDLYAMTLGTPDEATVPEPLLGGLPSDPVCYKFHFQFHAQFSPRQAETFRTYCPDWLIERGRAAQDSAD